MKHAHRDIQELVVQVDPTIFTLHYFTLDKLELVILFRSLIKVKINN